MNKLISEYLLYSYIYYKIGKSLISDKEFDKITIELLKNFDKIKDSDHIHKHLIIRSNLEASTGYDIKFPNIVKITGNEMVKEKEQVVNINDLF